MSEQAPMQKGKTRTAAPASNPPDVVLEEQIEEVLGEYLPEAQREPAAEAITEIFLSSFKGPIPPPESIAEYENVLPGSADRLFKMAEKEQDHRHDWERKALSTEKWYSLLGLSAGWTTAIGLAVSAAVVGIYGDWRVGCALAGASATGMVWKLVQGRSEDKAEAKAEQPEAKLPAKNARRRSK